MRSPHCSACARCRSPSPIRLQLFEQTRIEPGASTTFGGKSIVYDAESKPTPLFGQRRCLLAVGEDHVDLDTFDACPSVDLAYDPVAGRVIVLRESTDAIAVSGYAPDEISVHDLAGRLGAPRAWVYGALGGLAIAIGALLMALRFRRRAREANQAIETTHDGGGWITAFGAPRFVSDLVTCAPGPVVITAHDATRTPTYRDDGVGKIFKVQPGNRATLRAEAQVRMAAWAYVAIASVVTTSSPLWAARMFGIL